MWESAAQGRNAAGRAGILDPAGNLEEANQFLRDLIALSTLPALWLGAKPERIAESLLAVIGSTVSPQFGYIRIQLESAKNVVENAHLHGEALNQANLARATAAILSWAATHDPDELLPLVLAEGEAAVNVCVYPLGFDSQCGVLAVGFSEAGRPTALERTLLNTAANQAITAINNYRIHEVANALRKEAETLNVVARTLAAELDLQRVVQKATDAATELTGAQFGAFFYNVHDSNGESYMLYTLSGAEREAFAKFGLPRNTPLFDPTFRGKGVIRARDIHEHPSYGKVPPHYGMPKGHLPVRSYLAVPVVSRSGEVLGGLFFGHGEVDVFTERAERLATAIAAQAAIAIDNANLYGRAQRELEERKRAERALTQSRQQLALVTDIAPVFLAHCDAEGRYKFVNKRYAERFGLRPEQCVGKHISEIVGTRAYKSLGMHVQKVLSGQAVQFEMEIPYATIPIRFMHCCYEPEFGPEGKVIGFVAAITDITRRKEIEEALREGESLLRTVTNEAQVGLVLVSQEWRCLFANQAYADILGLDHSMIVGRRLSEFLPPELYRTVAIRLERAFAGEKATYETRVAAHAKTGQERYYEVIYDPHTNEVIAPYVVVVIVDVTERKKMQEALEGLVTERTGKLRETVQQLETFSYSIAHDMRAPLRSISSFASILAQEYSEKLDEPGRDFLSRIIGSASRMDGLITDVLNYSGVSTGRVDLKPVEIEKLVTELLIDYPQFTNERNSIEIRKPLPPVLGNTALLTQVLSNLLGNALKFIPRDRTPRIAVHASQRGDRVIVWVEDNGIGIAPEHHERIFGLFQRLHGQDEYAGTGVGLAIVRRAVERMGGQVGLESTPGQGTRFWFELPAANSV